MATRGVRCTHERPVWLIRLNFSCAACSECADRKASKYPHMSHRKSSRGLAAKKWPISERGAPKESIPGARAVESFCYFVRTNNESRQGDNKTRQFQLHSSRDTIFLLLSILPHISNALLLQLGKRSIYLSGYKG